MFRDGPTLTGESYAETILCQLCLCYFERQRGVLSHVMDAFQNSVADHTRDVFVVWGGVGRDINVIVVFEKNVKRYGCFPEHCSTPPCLWSVLFGVGWGVEWGRTIINVKLFSRRMSNLLLQNNVARHARDVFGVGVGVRGWGGTGSL